MDHQQPHSSRPNASRCNMHPTQDVSVCCMAGMNAKQLFAAIPRSSGSHCVTVDGPSLAGVPDIGESILPAAHSSWVATVSPKHN